MEEGLSPPTFFQNNIFFEICKLQIENITYYVMLSVWRSHFRVKPNHGGFSYFTKPGPSLFYVVTTVLRVFLLGKGGGVEAGPAIKKV